MDRRVTLIVFLLFWCLSHQQGTIIGLSVALSLVVVLVIATDVFCLLRRSQVNPGKPSQRDDHDNSVNGERQMHSLGNVSGVACQGGSSRGDDVIMNTSGVYETVPDRDLADAIQHRGVHQSEGQGRNAPDRDYVEPVTRNQPTSTSRLPRWPYRTTLSTDHQCSLKPWHDRKFAWASSL